MSILECQELWHLTSKLISSVRLMRDPKPSTLNPPEPKTLSFLVGDPNLRPCRPFAAQARRQAKAAAVDGGMPRLDNIHACRLQPRRALLRSGS